MPVMATRRSAIDGDLCDRRGALALAPSNNSNSRTRRDSPRFWIAAIISGMNSNGADTTEKPKPERAPRQADVAALQADEA